MIATQGVGFGGDKKECDLLLLKAWPMKTLRLGNSML